VATAGAHLDVPLVLPDGRATTRRYSIASDPARTDAWDLAVLAEPEGTGGSLAAHRLLAVGTRLNVHPPGNDFALHDDARPTVLIAGGIGITPLRAMAQALRATGRDHHLHYAPGSTWTGSWPLHRRMPSSMSVAPPACWPPRRPSRRNAGWRTDSGSNASVVRTASATPRSRSNCGDQACRSRSRQTRPCWKRSRQPASPCRPPAGPAPAAPARRRCWKADRTIGTPR
jgi:hypothetical protein